MRGRTFGLWPSVMVCTETLACETVIQLVNFVFIFGEEKTYMVIAVKYFTKAFTAAVYILESSLARVRTAWTGTPTPQTPAGTSTSSALCGRC